jgi:[protein-PII] uridylyltransferase
MNELVGKRPGGGSSPRPRPAPARSLGLSVDRAFHLHYVAGRAEERLTFDLQPVVGARMGYTRHGRQDGVERFMRHYFLTAREVTRLTHVLEPRLIRAALGPPAVPRTDRRRLIEGRLRAGRRQAALRPGATISPNRADPHAAHAATGARPRLELHPLAMRALIRNERRAVSCAATPRPRDLFLDLLCGQDGRTATRRWRALADAS